MRNPFRDHIFVTRFPGRDLNERFPVCGKQDSIHALEMRIARGDLDLGQFPTVRKQILPNTRHASRDRHRRETLTPVERAISNARHAVGDHYQLEVLAEPECLALDTCHTVRDGVTRLLLCNSHKSTAVARQQYTIHVFHVFFFHFSIPFLKKIRGVKTLNSFLFMLYAPKPAFLSKKREQTEARSLLQEKLIQTLFSSQCQQPLQRLRRQIQFFILDRPQFFLCFQSGHVGIPVSAARIEHRQVGFSCHFAEFRGMFFRDAKLFHRFCRRTASQSSG